MIEPMTHVAVVADAARRKDVLDWLYKARALHVMPFADEDADRAAAWAARFRPVEDSAADVEARVAQLSSVVSFCQENRSCQPGFLDQMFPLKLVTSKREMEEAVAACAPDRLAADLGGRRVALEKAQEALARLEQRRGQLRQFAFLGDALPALGRLRHVDFRVVAAQGEGEKGFLKDERVGREVEVEILEIDGPVTYFGLLAAPGDRAALDGLVDDHGLHVAAPPDAEGPATAELAAAEADIARARAALADARRGAAAFADAWDRKAEIALAYAESAREGLRRQPDMAAGAHVFAARGYARTADVERLRAGLEKDFDGAATLAAAAAPAGEEPPTHLRWNRLVRPAGLIVKMYGLPAYKGIDPTACVATIFFLFVGICLGDAVYGAALIAAMLWLKRRYRDQRGLQDFFNVFVYSGAVAMVVGTLTGGFFGDLLFYGAKWFPALRPAEDFRVNVLTQLDPLKQAQTALYIAVGIGVLTQLYGLALKTFVRLRNRDYMGAFSDGFLWFALIVSLVSLGLSKAGVFPEAVSGPMQWAVGLSVAGLVLTQGRENPNWFLRLMVGAISLYGIVGAYGLSAFLGDVISFARLMALNLTGAALGSTFNMLADLATGAGAVGVVLAVLILIGGHLMNFALAVLSAFVHSARLVMLEYFGRFYEAGGYAYAPHGYAHPTVEVEEFAAGE